MAFYLLAILESRQPQVERVKTWCLAVVPLEWIEAGVGFA
jgi:hypothetical protein